MILRKVYTIIGLALTLALFVLPQGVALSSPPFERTGRIDRLAVRQNKIVVNDETYILPASLDVYLYSKRQHRAKKDGKDRYVGNRRALRKGLHIGFNVEGEGTGQQRRIVKAWILPRGSVKESNE